MTNLYRMLPFLIFFSAFAQASWDSPPSGLVSVPPPPKAGSPEAKQELVTLHEMEHIRTDADCRLAMTQTIPSFETFYAHSELLSPVEDSAVGNFVQRAMALADKETTPLKKEYSRPRPYTEDPTLNPCAVKPKGSLSYPSSHSSMAKVGACVLGAIYPDRADQFEKYGEYLAQLRALSGVHHPSDVEAGVSVGEQICQYLLKDAEFQSDLKNLDR